MNQLDDLFKQAKELPVSYSLEDALSTLEANSGVPFPRRSNFGKWLLTKKVWIMISLITMAVMVTLLVPQKSQQEKQRHKSVQHETNQSDIKAENVKEAPVLKVRSIKEEIERDQFDLEMQLLPMQKLKPKKKEVRMPVFQPYRLYKERQEEYIPTLTEEQRKANERQKQKMLKALGKRDKKDYAYLPSSSILIFGRERSFQAFYMSTTEVTNLEYRTFLFDLIIQGRTADFLIARPDQQMWTKITTGDMNAMEEMYFSHEAYDDYPVVNISEEGAKMYCEWLDESYMKSSYVKKYGEIQPVRLPHYEEWFLAASNAGQDSIYPWGGAFPRNADGCYLANYRPKVEDYDDDGGFYTVKVDSYTPNKFGIFNLMGNVTEMVNTNEGIQHAGGGWMSPLHELRLDDIQHLQKREGPHPTDGFRIVFTYLGRHFDQ